MSRHVDTCAQRLYVGNLGASALATVGSPANADAARRPALTVYYQ